MKNIKNWKVYNESINNCDSMFLLKINDIFIGTDKYVDIPDFTFDEYVDYKENDNISNTNFQWFGDLMKEESGFEYEYDDIDNILYVSTCYGCNTEVELEPDEEYDESELEQMAIDEIGLYWEVIVNPDCENEYEKLKKVNEFNL